MPHNRVGYKNDAFNLPNNDAPPNCDEGSIWAKISAEELYTCLGGEKIIFHSGMSEIGPEADPDIISWVAGELTVNGNLVATNIGSVIASIVAIYATLGSFTTMETDTANIATANVATLNNTTLNVLQINTTDFSGYEKSSDPSDPVEGHYKIWMSNGTGSGDDGDIMIKITAGEVTKTTTLIDFSAI